MTTAKSDDKLAGAPSEAQPAWVVPPAGKWRSIYRYPSSSRHKVFESDSMVRLKVSGKILDFESIAKPEGGRQWAHLLLEGDVATGTWREDTDPNGYYRGAVFHGALQLVVAPDGRKMTGKWIGIGSNKTVNVGSWEFIYTGDDTVSNPPAKAKQL